MQCCALAVQRCAHLAGNRRPSGASRIADDAGVLPQTAGGVKQILKRGGEQCSAVLLQCSAALTCPSTSATRCLVHRNNAGALLQTAGALNNLKGDGSNVVLCCWQCSAAPTCPATAGRQMFCTSQKTPACSCKLRGGFLTIQRGRGAMQC